jgi:adenine/guanine phosphoribosyltransferase-like PRPP-binding protein
MRFSGGRQLIELGMLHAQNGDGWARRLRLSLPGEGSVFQGERVILVDDLVATGGTAQAAVKLLKGIGAEVLAACFIIDRPELGGADALRLGVLRD